MTPGFRAAVHRLEGQRRNFVRRIHGIRRLAAILLISAAIFIDFAFGAFGKDIDIGRFHGREKGAGFVFQ